MIRTYPYRACGHEEYVHYVARGRPITRRTMAELTGIVRGVVLGCALLMDEGFRLTVERTLGKDHGEVGVTGTVSSVSTGGYLSVYADAGCLRRGPEIGVRNIPASRAEVRKTDAASGPTGWIDGNG